MHWKGPLIDGVTQSLINKFLECPYAFYIYAILGLEEDLPFPDNLMWGDTFHKGLEILIETKDRETAAEAIKEHLSENYPTAPPSYKYSTIKMLDLYNLKRHMRGDWKAELVMDQIVSINGMPIRFRGKLDGLCEDHDDYGRLLVEHKCKGYIDPVLVKEEIGQDLQCNIYMYLHDVENVAYDLIKIPEAQKFGPAPSYGESPKEWAEKIFHGPIGSYGGNYPIFKAPHKWVHQHVYLLPREEQEVYWSTTVKPIVLRMVEWFEYVTDDSFDIENPESYGPLFYKHPIRHFSGRKTDKFKCPYHSLLIGESDMDDLIPVSSYFSELENV